MSWPLSQDFNEAVQTPARTFADADLQACKVAAGPGGVPRPRSGNFADVYRLDHPDGRAWAVKLFTRPVAPTLQHRYAEVAAHLNSANLPFTLPFEYFPEGIRVRGKLYPALKMPWVDGFPINQFVKDNLGRATVLESMLAIWVRLCRRLRETGMAHADLQHGNVLLVPGGKAGALGLMLVDYDGMFVPALANQPSGELGHPAFQHPERAFRNIYSADLDRFPHLVVATALRALLVGGEGLWKRYDTGDNLLFGAKDFLNPRQSKLMRELWDTGDPFTVGLVGHLALACGKPLAATPWLDQLMPEGRPPMLTPSQERQAGEILGPGTVAVAVPPPRPVPVKSSGGMQTIAAVAVGGVLLIGALTGGVIAFAGGNSTSTAETVKVEPVAEPAKPDPTPAPAPAPVEKPPEPVTPILPPVADPPKPVVVPVVAVPIAAQAPATDKAVSFAATDGTAFPDNVRLSADGAYVLVPERGTNKVHTFAAKTGAKVATFQTFTGAKLVYVAPLPGNKAVAGVSGEPALIVYDALTGRPAGRVPHTLAAVAGISASKDGKYVLVLGGGRAAVIDVDTGAEVVGRDSADPASAVLSAASPWVAIADPKGTVGITPLRAGKPGFVNPKLGPVAVQAWEPKNHRVALRTLVAGKPGGDIHVWGTEAPFAEVKILIGPYMPCPPAFTADGTKFFAAKENAVEVWDTATWAKTGEHKVRGAEIIALDVSDDGSVVVAVAADKKCHVFGTPAAAGVAGMPGPAPVPAMPAPAVVAAAPLKPLWAVVYDDVRTHRPRSFVFAAGGTKIYVPDAFSGPTHVFDAETGAKVLSVPDLGSTVGVAAAGMGKVLAVPNGMENPAAGTFSSAKVWEDTGGRTVDTFRLPSARATIVGGAADGRVALLREGMGKYSLLDPATGRVTALPQAGRGVAKLSPNGGHLAVVDEMKLKLFSAADGRQITSFDLPAASVSSVAVNNGGRLVAVLNVTATGALSSPIIIYDAAGKVVHQLTGPNWGGNNTAVAFSGDGRWLAAAGRPAGEDARLELFDTLSWASAGRTAEPVLRDAGFAFSPDSSKLVVWGEDRLIRAYAVPKATAAMPAEAAVMPAVPAAARKPAPAPEALTAADAVVRAAYKEEFLKRSAADRKKFAERLLKDAADTADLPGKYVMLKEAVAAAADGNDLALAGRAADQLGGEFDIDAAALKIQAVEKVAASSSLTAVLRSTAEAATELAEEYADKDQFDPAVRLLGVAAGCYGKASLTALRLEAEGRAAQVKKLRDAFEPVKAAAAALKANPQDLPAALLVGKYRCFVQRRWDDGLPLLAVAAEGKLKELALLDVRAATDAETTDVKRGDGWWAYAATLPEAERPAVQLRARYWYAKALTNLRGGLERRAAEDKLVFSIGNTEYRPGLVCETVAIPGRKKVRVKLEPAVDGSGGDYAGFTPTVGVRFVGFLVPPAPGRYKLVAETAEIMLVKIGTSAEQKTVIDIQKAGRETRREAAVLLGDKPAALVVELVLPANALRTFKLKWVRPGGTAEETVPADALYHPKAAEKDLTEK